MGKNVEDTWNCWFSIVTESVPVTRSIPKAKWEILAKKMSHEDFKEQIIRLWRWKQDIKLNVTEKNRILIVCVQII